MDVVRDYRWGRVEETFGEDPYLVGTIGTAYVRGLERPGIVATLKHFAGYSASSAARNHAPVSMGPRTLRDVILLPFEMAIREGGARSVMNSYSEIDGLPVAADAALLTGVLRDEWGFEGIVVSDYWSIAFLLIMHRVAATAGRGGRARRCGRASTSSCRTCAATSSRSTCPTSSSTAPPAACCARRPSSGCSTRLGVRRRARPAARPRPAGAPRARPRAGRGVRRAARQRRDAAAGRRHGSRSSARARTTRWPSSAATRTPTTASCRATADIGPRHRGADAARRAARRAAGDVAHEPGCPISEPDRSGIPAAVEAARAADVCIAVVGDRPGLFGRGTSGEGCDAADLALPGVQGELVDALLATGTPVVLVVVSGRPYALGRHAGRRGRSSRRSCPARRAARRSPASSRAASTRRASCPCRSRGSPGGQPGTYLHPPLGGNSEGVSNLDPTPLFPFGHGLSYTRFDYDGFALERRGDRHRRRGRGELTVRNAGDRAGAEVVQLYLSDPVAQRHPPRHPARRLRPRGARRRAAAARVTLPPARRPHRVHRRRPARGSSSPARSSC